MPNPILHILFFFIISELYSTESNADTLILNASCLDSVINITTTQEYLKDQRRPHPMKFFLRKKIERHKKFVAAALAFPFPFGIVGLHRIYMGTKPHVPVFYIATFGGALGVLPFIDFCIIVLDKKCERYFNNPRLFMWIEPESPSPSGQTTPP